MFKNNLSQSQLYSGAEYPANLRIPTVLPMPANGRKGFAAKAVFTGMIVAGFALVNPALLNTVNSSKAPVNVDAAKVRLVLPVKYTALPDPSLLTIPSLNLAAAFEPLGLQPDHTIEVPKNNLGVGWFIYGAKPGETGASVVVGHLNSEKGRAIFADLNKIKPGDLIFIKRVDNSVVTYRVDSLSEFSQDNFPIEAVYGAVTYPAIRLITCTGTYNKKTGHYSENLVVFGSKVIE